VKIVIEVADRDEEHARSIVRYHNDRNGNIFLSSGYEDSVLILIAEIQED
jgi:hypothetical protein